MNDFFGKDASKLTKKKLWLFDMDGTIYEEGRLFDGTLELLSAIEKKGGRYVFITNNSSNSVADYVKKINNLGVRANKDNFFTSTQATILFLRQYYPNAKVYCQGTKSFVTELINSDIDITEEIEPVEVVLVGFDTELTMDKLRKSCEILSTQSVAFLATNPDLACPVSFGFIPDCGSICTMIKNATGKIPRFIGKPESTMIDIVREKYRVSKEETVVVGDRLYTDIASGQNAGVSTVCVLTGEATADDVIKEKNKPTFTFENIKSIYTVFSALNSVQFSKTTLREHICSDISICENALLNRNEQYIFNLCKSLRQKYDFAFEIRSDDGSEAIREMMYQFMNSIK